MRISLTLLALIGLIPTGYAQKRLVQAINRWNMGLLPTGVHYSKEIPLASKATLEGAAGVGLTYYLGTFAIQFRTSVAVDYKFYYALDKAQVRAEDKMGNNGPFIGVSCFSDLFPWNKLQQSKNRSFLLGGAIFWGKRQQIKDSGFQLTYLVGPSFAMEGLSTQNPALYLRTGLSYLF